jgi:hypothetical protein
VLAMTSKKRPFWQRVLLTVLAGYALFCGVVLFLAFWWDFLPQSMWFVAPILLILVGLTWLARQGMMSHVVLTVLVWLVIGAVLIAVVHLAGLSSRPLVGSACLAMGPAASGLIRWWESRRTSLG